MHSWAWRSAWWGVGSWLASPAQPATPASQQPQPAGYPSQPATPASRPPQPAGHPNQPARHHQPASCSSPAGPLAGILLGACQLTGFQVERLEPQSLKAVGENKKSWKNCFNKNLTMN